MRPFTQRALVGIFLTMVCLVPAWAVPITWTLNGVTSNDGGIASGSFTYDADTNQFSAINIVTTTGASVTGATFFFVGNASGPFIDLYLTIAPSNNLTGTPVLNIAFTPGLTNAGGTVALSGTQATCSSATCSGGISAPIRVTTAGEVVSTSTGAIVSTPAISLFGLMLLGAALLWCVPACGRNPTPIK